MKRRRKLKPLTTMKLIEIQNRAGKLRLNDGVHKESADKLIQELDTLYGASAVAAQMVIGEAVCRADDALESVEVEINSPGGSVFEGQRIYNALRGISERGVEVTTTVNGLAASMGSVILMAGDKKQMTHGSRIMIHEASTIAWGDARTMRKQADLLEGISSEIAGIYAERTGGEPKAIRNLMFAETWMTADEAKENGFVDTVLKDGKAKAGFDTGGKGMSIFARLFPDNAEAVAKLDLMLEENDTLRADLEAAQARVGELTPLAEVNAQLQTELAEFTAKVATLEGEIVTFTAQVVDLTAAATVTDEKVSIKAAELLAAQGHPAPVVLTGDGGTTGTDFIAELGKLQGEDRTSYYNEHKAEIRKALTKS